MKPSIERARELRNVQTKTEAVFWRRVRNRGLGDLKVRRQAPIGPYVADFLIEAAKLVVELDGDSHGLDEGRAHDLARDAFLRREGFWNAQVHENVVDVLDHVLHVALQRMQDAEGADPSPETAPRFRPLPGER